MRKRQIKQYLKKEYEKVNKDCKEYQKDLAELEAGRELEYSDELRIVRLITAKLEELRDKALERYLVA